MGSPRHVAGLALALALGATAGCGKGRGAPVDPVAAPALGTTGELWALAPAGLTVGVAFADGSLGQVHDAVLALLGALEGAPGGAEIALRLRRELAEDHIELGGGRAALRAMGLDLGRGAAVFDGPVGPVFVLPVVERAAFVARVGGQTAGETDTLGDGALTCRMRGSRYLCAAQVAGLDAVGQGAGAIELATWPAALRGSIEAWVPPLGPLATSFAGSRGVRMGVRFERGGLTARVHATGSPAMPLVALASAGRSPLVVALAERRPIGALIIDLSPLASLGLAGALGMIPDDARVGPVSLRELVGSLRGDLVGWAEHGAPARGQAAIGLTAEGPARALVAACQLPVPLPMLTLARDGERCRVTLLAQPGTPEIVADAWVDGGALRLGLGAFETQADAPESSAIGRELAAGHAFAVWGQGSALGTDGFTAQLAAVPMGGLVLWSLAHLTEFGFGARIASDGVHGLVRIRTTFGNPEALVAALEPLLAAFARGDAGALEKIRALAATDPDSPLATDLAAGSAGLASVAAPVGVLAAIAIPAFMKYIRKSKTAEPRMQLRRLFDAATLYALERNAGTRFPAPSAGPTPPLGTCCAAGSKCPADPGQWALKPWSTLGFAVDDPHYFSYQYVVAPDGLTFTARAFGDLDCDGAYSTFSMTGAIDAAGDVTGAASYTAVDELE